MLICAPDGGIVNDPILLKLAEDHFWLSLADSDALLYALGVQAFADMDVEIREPDVSPLQIQGPRSKPLIRKLFGDAVADLRYYWHEETELDGIPVVVSRTGWTGEVGYEVYLRDASRGTELWDAVMEAGEEFDFRAIAPSDQRRMEAGIFNYGNDMDVTNNPFEVTGLERLVELDNDNTFVSRDGARADRGRRRAAQAGRREDRRTSRSAMWLEDFWPVTVGGPRGRPARPRARRTRLASTSTWATRGCRSSSPPRARASQIESPGRPDERDGGPAPVPRSEEGRPEGKG